MKRTAVKLVALALALLLAGCAVQVMPANSTAASTAEPTAAPTEAAPTPAPTPEGPRVITADQLTSDPGSPNSREELVKRWPEFSADREVEAVCFEWGWTGPVAEKDFVTPEIQKRTGLQLKYTPMITNSEEELNTKLNLMISTGEVPEIYFGANDPYSLDVYEKLGQAGKLYDIGPYIEEYKLIHELLAPELIKYRRSDASGLHNWFIPTQTGRGNDLIHNAGSGLFLRKDLLEKLGMDYPTTMEQFVTYLRRCRDEIKEINGQPIIPLLFEEDLGGTFHVLGTYFGPELSFNWQDNYKPLNIVFSNHDRVKTGVKLLNVLYGEGLIDRECVAMKREQYAQKISSGRVAAFTGAWWDMNTFSDNAKSDVPEIMYVLTKPLDDPTFPKADRKWTNPIAMYSALTVSKSLDEDTLKHFMALLDYLTTLDGQMLVQAGLPGKSFELDNNGKYKFLDEFKQSTDNLDWNKVAATGVYYWSQLVFNLPAFDELRAEYPELVREDNYLGFLNREKERTLYDREMLPPKDYFFEAGPIEREKIGTLMETTQKLITDCILAKDEAEVDKLVEAYALKCKELGVDEIMSERQQLIEAIDIDDN